MGIRLVPYIPDDLIFRKLKYQVHRHRKFHDPKIRRKMSPALTNLLNQKLPNLQRKLLQFFGHKRLDIVFLLYPL